MSLASDLLPKLDEIRAIPGDLGLRPFTVTLKVTTWSGARVGVGTPTTTSTLLTTGGGGRVKVASVSEDDIVASGGRYSKEDLKIGPMTPGYPGGGVSHDAIDPTPTSTPTEVRFQITGPGYDSAGDLFEKVGQEFDSALHLYVIVRKTGRK